MSADDTAPRILALIGLRASGKTTVGRLLARKLDRAFVDLDDEIATLDARENGGARRAAGEILAERGEPAFRDLEERALAAVFDRETPCVLATGGGVVERPSNRARLARDATCVWLVVDVAELQRRMRASRTSRPSLTGKDPVDEIADIERRRRASYEEIADVRIDCASRTIAEITDEIARRLPGA